MSYGLPDSSNEGFILPADYDSGSSGGGLPPSSGYYDDSYQSAPVQQYYQPDDNEKRRYYQQVAEQYDPPQPDPTAGLVEVDPTAGLVEVPNRGALGEIGTGIARGFRGELPAMIGRGMQYISEPGNTVSNLGQSIRNYGQEYLDRPENQLAPELHNAVTNALAEGGEQLAPSVAAPAAIGAGALALGAAPAIASGAAILGGALPAALSQGQEDYEAAKKAGLSEQDAINAARINALYEYGGEALGTAAMGPALGVGGKLLGKAISPAMEGFAQATSDEFLKPALKGIAKSAVEETGVEMGQAAAQQATRNAYNYGDGQSPWEAAKDVIGPTLGMQALLIPLGMGAHGLHSNAISTRNNIISDPNSNVDLRRQAINQAAKEIYEKDEQAGINFLDHATDALVRKAPLEISPDLIKPFPGAQQQGPVEEEQAPPPAPPPQQQPVYVNPQGQAFVNPDEHWLNQPGPQPFEDIKNKGQIDPSLLRNDIPQGEVAEAPPAQPQPDRLTGEARQFLADMQAARNAGHDLTGKRLGKQLKDVAAANKIEIDSKKSTAGDLERLLTEKHEQLLAASQQAQPAPQPVQDEGALPPVEPTQTNPVANQQQTQPTAPQEVQSNEVNTDQGQQGNAQQRNPGSGQQNDTAAQGSGTGPAATDEGKQQVQQEQEVNGGLRATGNTVSDVPPGTTEEPAPETRADDRGSAGSGDVQQPVQQSVRPGAEGETVDEELQRRQRQSDKQEAPNVQGQGLQQNAPNGKKQGTDESAEESASNDAGPGHGLYVNALGQPISSEADGSGSTQQEVRQESGDQSGDGEGVEPSGQGTGSQQATQEGEAKKVSAPKMWDSLDADGKREAARAAGLDEKEQNIISDGDTPWKLLKPETRSKIIRLHNQPKEQAQTDERNDADRSPAQTAEAGNENAASALGQSAEPAPATENKESDQATSDEVAEVPVQRESEQSEPNKQSVPTLNDANKPTTQSLAGDVNAETEPKASAATTEPQKPGAAAATTDQSISSKKDGSADKELDEHGHDENTNRVIRDAFSVVSGEKPRTPYEQIKYIADNAEPGSEVSINGLSKHVVHAVNDRYNAARDGEEYVQAIKDLHKEGRLGLKPFDGPAVGIFTHGFSYPVVEDKGIKSFIVPGQKKEQEAGSEQPDQAAGKKSGAIEFKNGTKIVNLADEYREKAAYEGRDPIKKAQAEDAKRAFNRDGEYIRPHTHAVVMPNGKRALFKSEDDARKYLGEEPKQEAVNPPPKAEEPLAETPKTAEAPATPPQETAEQQRSEKPSFNIDRAAKNDITLRKSMDTVNNAKRGDTVPVKDFTPAHATPKSAQNHAESLLKLNDEGRITLNMKERYANSKDADKVPELARKSGNISDYYDSFTVNKDKLDVAIDNGDKNTIREAIHNPETSQDARARFKEATGIELSSKKGEANSAVVRWANEQKSKPKEVANAPRTELDDGRVQGTVASGAPGQQEVKSENPVEPVPSATEAKQPAPAPEQEATASAEAVQEPVAKEFNVDDHRKAIDKVPVVSTQSVVDRGQEGKNKVGGYAVGDLFVHETEKGKYAVSFKESGKPFLSGFNGAADAQRAAKRLSSIANMKSVEQRLGEKGAKDDPYLQSISNVANKIRETGNPYAEIENDKDLVAAKDKETNEKLRAKIDEAAAKAATSDKNEIPLHDGKLKANTSEIGPVRIHGMPISIENGRGTTKTNLEKSDLTAARDSLEENDPARAKLDEAIDKYGTDRKAAFSLARKAQNRTDTDLNLDDKYAKTMSADYGRFTDVQRDKNGDHIKAYIGDNPTSDKAYVVDQINPKTGEFDQHKVVLGATSQEEATRLYDDHFPEGESPRQAVSEVNVKDLKKWLRNGDTTKPFSEQATAKEQTPEEETTNTDLATKWDPKNEDWRSVVDHTKKRLAEGRSPETIREELHGLKDQSDDFHQMVDDAYELNSRGELPSLSQLDSKQQTRKEPATKGLGKGLDELQSAAEANPKNKAYEALGVKPAEDTKEDPKATIAKVMQATSGGGTVTARALRDVTGLSKEEFDKAMTGLRDDDVVHLSAHDSPARLSDEEKEQHISDGKNVYVGAGLKESAEQKSPRDMISDVTSALPNRDIPVSSLRELSMADHKDLSDAALSLRDEGKVELRQADPANLTDKQKESLITDDKGNYYDAIKALPEANTKSGITASNEEAGAGGDSLPGLAGRTGDVGRNEQADSTGNDLEGNEPVAGTANDGQNFNTKTGEVQAGTEAGSTAKTENEDIPEIEVEPTSDEIESSKPGSSGTLYNMRKDPGDRRFVDAVDDGLMNHKNLKDTAENNSFQNFAAAYKQHAKDIATHMGKAQSWPKTYDRYMQWLDNNHDDVNEEAKDLYDYYRGEGIYDKSKETKASSGQEDKAAEASESEVVPASQKAEADDGIAPTVQDIMKSYREILPNRPEGHTSVPIPELWDRVKSAMESRGEKPSRAKFNEFLVRAHNAWDGGVQEHESPETLSDADREGLFKVPHSTDRADGPRLAYYFQPNKGMKEAEERAEAARNAEEAKQKASEPVAAGTVNQAKESAIEPEKTDDGIPIGTYTSDEGKPSTYKVERGANGKSVVSMQNPNGTFSRLTNKASNNYRNAKFVRDHILSESGRITRAKENVNESVPSDGNEQASGEADKLFADHPNLKSAANAYINTSSQITKDKVSRNAQNYVDGLDISDKEKKSLIGKWRSHVTDAIDKRDNPEAYNVDTEQAEAPANEKPQVALAKAITEHFNGQKQSSGPVTQLGSKQLFQMADTAYGGTQAQGKYIAKHAYDSFEAGLNRHILDNQPERMDNVDAARAKELIAANREAQKLYPPQTKRSDEQKEMQQFSTPHTHAEAMAWAANIGKNDVFMEPSAGTGNLVTHAMQYSPAEVHANELAPDRADLLQSLSPDIKMSRENAMHINAIKKDIKPTVVVMNPPFSADVNKKGVKDLDVGGSHVDAALGMLAPNGRLVALVGRGMGLNEKGEPQPRMRKWWDAVKSKYNVRAAINIPGKEYSKFGTQFDNTMLIIDKTGPTKDPVLSASVNKVEEIPDLIKDIRNDRIPAGEREQAKQGKQKSAEGTEREAGSGQPVQPSADTVVSDGKQEKPASQRPARPGKRTGAANDNGTEKGRGSTTEGGKRGGSDARSKAEPADVSDSPDLPTAGQDVVTDKPISTKGADTGPLKVVAGKQNKTKLNTESKFATYIPSATVEGAKPHPTPLAESAAMASVKTPKPTYVPSIPKDIVESGRLSDAQMTNIIYAGQSHEMMLPDGSRRGYFVGDGCVSAETRIYDPETGKYTPIKELADRGNPITVLSLSDEGLVSTNATAPFLKGTANLFRVTLNDGRQITVTEHHKFLTPQGWQTLAGGISVGDYLACAETDLSLGRGADSSVRSESAQSYSRTPQDCLGDCSSYFRPYNERFLPDGDSALASSPSQDGACKRIRPLLRTGDLEISGEYTHPHQPERLRSKNSFSPSGSLDLSLIGPQAASTPALLSTPKHLVSPPSLAETILPHRSNEAVPLRRVEPALGLSRYETLPECRASTERNKWSAEKRHALSQALLSASQQGIRQQPAVQYGVEPYSAFSAYRYSAWRKVASVEFVGIDAFYDMFVPGTQNYVAEGVINHNTGVGKGAQIAGIISDNWNKGRTKAVWVSENQKLYKDAMRDVEWVGMSKDNLMNQGDLKGPIQAKKGVIFTTYDTLKSESDAEKDATGKITKEATKRIDQLINWLGEDFDGVIAFDEAHNMANSLETKDERGLKKASGRALIGVELQRRLPNARVVYASATGATEVANLAYGDRLGLWGDGTAFATKDDFISEIEAGGVAAMEVVAKDLKTMGLYQARGLSYDGVDYRELLHDLTDEQSETYDTLAEAWQNVLANVEAVMNATKAAKNGRAKSAALSAFWSSHQRFFNQVITAMQMPTVIKDIEKQLKDGNSIVLQLVNTNEAIQERRLAQAAAEGLDIDSVDFTPRDILMQYVSNSFPIGKYEEYVDENGNKQTRPVMDSSGNVVEDPEAVAVRDNLIERLANIPVPDSVLDQLFNHFGSDAVAEITGRKRRFVRQKDGSTVEEKVSNATAKKDESDFMEGKKRILVFSDAGGTGRSYHASRAAKNQQRRIHYPVQPGWRADKAIQGMGRTHRTNQAEPPTYVLPTTSLKAQRRFMSSIARRMASMGALTKGQRDASGGGLFSAEMNLENEYGAAAVYSLIEDASMGRGEVVTKDLLKKGMGLNLWDNNGSLVKTKIPSVPQFLNRLLSLDTKQMDDVFDAFYQRLSDNVEYARQNGTLDTGMETISADSIKLAEEQELAGSDLTGSTFYNKLELTDPVRFTEFDDLPHAYNPEFLKNQKSGKVYAIVPGKTITDVKTGKIKRLMEVIGVSGRRYMNEDEIDKSRYENLSKLSKPQLRAEWDNDIANSPKTRTKEMHVISGALLPVWDRLPASLPKIVRLQTDDGKQILGRVIRPKELTETLKRLGATIDQQRFTPEQYARKVLEGGATLELANGWKIERRQVSGEHRIEVTGYKANDLDSLRKAGAFSEIIAYRGRVFIPTENAGDVLGRIVESKPVIDMVGGEGVDVGAPLPKGTVKSQANKSPDNAPSSHPEWATSFEPQSNGRVVWSSGDIALMQGHSLIDGSPVYPGIKKDKGMMRVDVDSFNNERGVYTENELKELQEAKKQAVTKDQAEFEKNPDGPFKKGETFASSKNIPEWLAETGKEWAKMLGIPARIYLTTVDDARTADNMYGPFAAIRSALFDGIENGSTRRLSNGDHYISLPNITRKSQALEQLAHELGHVLQKETWDNANGAEKAAVLRDYENWLSKAGEMNAKQWVEKMRAHTVGKLTKFEGNAAEMSAKDMPAYWRKFNEYFADQVSRWATTSEKPLSVLDRFFKKIADAMRKLYGSLAGKKYLPDEAMKAYLDARANGTTVSEKGSGSAGSDAGEADYILKTVSMNAAKQSYQKLFGKKMPPGTAVQTPSGTWDAGPITLWSSIVHALQDHTVDLKDIMDAIRRTGKDILESMDARIKEELFHERAAKRIKNFEKHEFDPVLEAMRQENVDVKEIDEYLWNRHAEEANEHIAQINPNNPGLQDGGSGIKTADARAYLKNLTADQRRKYERIASLIDDMVEGTQELLVAGGVESQSTINAWRGKYKHYVPLHKDEMDNENGFGGPRTGKGHSVFGGFVKRRTGSTAARGNILANINDARQRAILRVEKARVGRALYRLAKDNPNAKFWNIEREPRIRVVRGKGKNARVIEIPEPGWRDNPNVFMVKMQDRHGEVHERFIVFNKDDKRAMRLAAAMKNMDVDDLGHVLSWVGKATRFIASMNTQYNPVFGAFNFVRDAGAAMANLSTTELAGEQGTILKHLYPSFQTVLSMEFRGDKSKRANTPLGKRYEEMQEAGGTTGFRDPLLSPSERTAKIQKQLKNANTKAGKAKAMFGLLRDSLSAYNTAMENATRLAVYHAAREAGHSKDKAASMAKNITVNFNRKGAMAPQLGAMYAFFNASVQGTATTWKTLKGPAGKKIALGAIGLGAIQAAIMYANDWDDKDIKDFVQDRNFVIPTGDGGHLNIPLPLGLHVLFRASSIFNQFALHDFKDPGKSVSKVLNLFADALNPIGNAGMSAQSFTPTLLDPMVALSENKDYTGAEISKEDFNKLHPTPGFSRSRDGATALSKWIAEGLNTLTFGNHYKQGFISPTADQIDYLAGQIAGGVGREGSKAVQSIAALANGEDLPWNKIPGAGRLYGNVNEKSAQQGRFYEYIKDLNELGAEYKGRIKDGDIAGAKQFLKENPVVQIQISKAGDKFERKISELRSMMRHSTDPKMKQRIRDNIEARISEFNKRYEQLTK
jgi:predicted RNA methylase